MKRSIIISSLLLSVSSYSFGAHLSAESAYQRFLADNTRNLIQSPGGKKFTLLSTEGNLYIFGLRDGAGFAVLPNDDSAPAVLGYSSTGSFSYHGNPALESWMKWYNSQLESVRTSGEGSALFQIPLRDRAEVSPLLSTEWNQEAPYNDLCPKVDGRGTVTGCVATAMAQAMKYYNYPAKGKGTHSYYWRPGEEELTFDYDSSPFAWDEMTDRYDAGSSDAARKAVAELMLACGISVDMHYEPGESGAATTQMGASLIDIFGYSKSLWMPNRVFYGYYEWEDMIYRELAEGRPVLYSGAGTDGGHQFICDGFKDGYFHFNWGWGGLSDGYFLLTALNPDDLGVGGGAGGFNSGQVATLGFRPATGDDEETVYVMYNTIGFESDVKNVKADETFRCTGEYFNYSLATLPGGSRLGMKFLDLYTDKAIFVEGPDVTGYHNGDGRYDLQIRFPKLDDGNYEISPVLKVNDKWSVVRMPVGYPSVIRATVTDGEAILSDQAMAEVTVDDIVIPAIIFADRDFPMTFKVENSGTEEFYNHLTPYLLDTSGKVVASSVFRPVDVMPGSTENVTDYIGKFTPVKDEELMVGEYSLVWRDNRGNDISRPLTVKVEVVTDATEVTITDFRLAQATPVEAPEAVKFSFTIRCDKGYFYNAPHLAIFHADGGYELYGITGERYYVLAGEEKEGEVTADLSRLADGEYMGVLYYDGHQIDNVVYFKIERVTSGIEWCDPIRESTEKETLYYDLNGVEILTPTRTGIYIINRQKILVK